jgi:hypothetical protein
MDLTYTPSSYAIRATSTPTEGVAVTLTCSRATWHVIDLQQSHSSDKDLQQSHMACH